MPVKLYLQPNEQTILGAASQIFSGLVTANKVTRENDQQFIDYSVNVAIQMAKRIEKVVKSKEKSYSMP